MSALMYVVCKVHSSGRNARRPASESSFVYQICSTLGKAITVCNNMEFDEAIVRAYVATAEFDKNFEIDETGDNVVYSRDASGVLYAELEVSYIFGQ
jgi:hypothetical protein